MKANLVATFDRLADAEAARNALIGAGFAPTAIHLVSREDEAGPVQGNFTVGDGRPDTHGDPYDRNYDIVQHRGTLLMNVEVDDDAHRRVASEILQGRADIG
jgi:hypothetical protein